MDASPLSFIKGISSYIIIVQKKIYNLTSTRLKYDKEMKKHHHFSGRMQCLYVELDGSFIISFIVERCHIFYSLGECNLYKFLKF